MEGTTRLFISIGAIITCIKLLLIPAYKSTDFEVHRNWLAISHSLPLSQWYTDETSQWTLDYPPLFAWMEKLFSCVAVYFDSNMLIVTNLNYASELTVLFQRLSVAISDIVMMYAVWCWIMHCAASAPSKKNDDRRYGCADPRVILTLLSLSSVGLIIVDSIHFQYNGILSGILLLSMLRIIQGRHLEGAFWFAVLLNLKHIYLYIAPAYGVYLLRAYCFSSNKSGKVILKSFSPIRFVTLGSIVIIVFMLSFGPFIYLGQVPQVISRLFPFKRGLCHAYWAPNFWALYNIADKALDITLRKLQIDLGGSRTEASMTGGLVQEFEHAVLPTILPLHTLILTGLGMLPSVLHIWRHPYSAKSFIRCVVMCAFSSYMFGWHVHEKAILLISIPLACLVVVDMSDARFFLLLSSIGYYSLFPLIFTSAETLIKYCLLAAHILFSFHAVGKLFEEESCCHSKFLKKFCLPLLSILETVYLFGLIVNEFYCQLVHSWLGLQDRLPFLPLMLTSVYCSVGIVFLYLWTNIRYYLLDLP